MQTVLHARAILTAPSAAPRNRLYAALLRLTGSPGVLGGKRCTIRVALWEEVGYVRAQRAGVEGLLPLLHLGSVNKLGAHRGTLPWHLRPYARRKEPPHRARSIQ